MSPRSTAAPNRATSSRSRAERGSGARLLFETMHALLVLSELFGQEFERDLAIEPRVFGEVDLPHPTCANEREYAIRAELLPCEQLALL